MRLRAAAPEDAAAIAAIYAPYVTASATSFETEPPDPTAMASRIAAGGDLYPWIIADDESGGVAGYAYASAFRPRPAYRYAVETSVYLSQDRIGAGLGKRLYASLIATLEAQGFAQAIGAIALPNRAACVSTSGSGSSRRGSTARWATSSGPGTMSGCGSGASPLPPIRRRSRSRFGSSR